MVSRRITALDGSGICLHCYLDTVDHRKMMADCVEQSAYLLRGKQTRGATTQKNADQLATVCATGFDLYVCEQCVQVATARRAITCGIRIEIAVRTLPNAPWQMDVQ
jgi:hypothetical protein